MNFWTTEVVILVVIFGFLFALSRPCNCTTIQEHLKHW